MAEDEPDRDVLSSLPRTRPQRRSAKRDAPAKRASPAGGKRATTANGKRAAGGARAAKGGRSAKAAPKRAAAGAPAAEGGASGRAAAKSKAAPRAEAPKMPPAGFQPPRDVRGAKPPSGTELLGTAIQAAGELAQIGLAVGGHALRSALDRLPPRRGT